MDSAVCRKAWSFLSTSFLSFCFLSSVKAVLKYSRERVLFAFCANTQTNLVMSMNVLVFTYGCLVVVFFLCESTTIPSVKLWGTGWRDVNLPLFSYHGCLM